MQTGRLKQTQDCLLGESKQLEKSLKLPKARDSTTSSHRPHASDFSAKGRTRLHSRIVLTENSECQHTATGHAKSHHRKAVSLIDGAKEQPLFLKVKQHHRLNGGPSCGGHSTRHRRSASNRDHKNEEDSKVSPFPSYLVVHNRYKSLTIDLDSLEMEYHVEALSNCSTKKIIAKRVTSASPDIKLVTYIKRFCRLYGQPPPSSLSFYRLGELVGKGAFSCVYSAASKLTSVPVALKSIEKSSLTDPRRSRKLTQEIETMRLVRHPHLVKLYDIIETQTHVHLVLEYLSEGSLLAFVQTRGKLQENNAKPLFMAVARGLKALHDHGIVHRDVKLDNILIGEGGAKLADFGVSRALRSGEHLLDSVGTPSYLAPETLTGKDYEGEPVDVWSLGVSLYGLLCGTLPFKGFNFATLHMSIESCALTLPSDLSWSAKDLLRRLLSPQPAKRISLADALQHPWLRGTHIREPSDNSSIDSAILAETANLGFAPDVVIQSVKTKEVNLASATYEMLHDLTL